MAIKRDKVLSAARKFVRKGRWDKAVEQYQKLVDDDPSDTRSQLKVADLSAKLGRIPEALDAYRVVAQHYSRDEMHEKAVAVYKQAIRLDDDDPDFHRGVGNAYHHLGRIKDAIRALNRAQKIYRARQDGHAQREVLERMVEIDPDDLGLRIKLAERYAKDQLVGRAVELFEWAQRKLDEEGRLDEWIQVTERLVYLRDDELPARRRIIELYLSRDDNKKALKHLQVCFQKDPDDLDTLSLLAEVFHRLDRVSKAVTVLTQLAGKYEDAGREREAHDVWRKILGLDPNHPKARKKVAAGPPIADIQSHESNPAPSDESDALDGIEFLDDDPQEPRAGAGGAEWSRQQTRPALDRSGDLGQLLDVVAEVDVFAANPPPEMQAPMAALGEQEHINEQLKETDVFLKYNLFDKADELLGDLIAQAPDHLGVRQKMRELCKARRDVGGEVAALIQLARMTASTPLRAQSYLEEALNLDENTSAVRRAAERLGIEFDQSADAEASALRGRRRRGPRVSSVTVDSLEDAPAGLNESTEVEDEDIVLIEDDVIEIDEGDFVEMGADPGFDEWDLDEADIIEEFSDADLVKVSRGDGANSDLYVTDEEAEEMFNDLFADVVYTGDNFPPGQWTPLQDGPNSLSVGDRLGTGNHAPVEGQPDHQIQTAPLQRPAQSNNPFGSRSLSQAFEPDAATQQALQDDHYGLDDAEIANTNLELGYAYMDMGLFEEAISEFETALDDPDAAHPAWLQIAVCRHKLGDHDTALMELNVLLQQEDIADDVRRAALEVRDELSSA